MQNNVNSNISLYEGHTITSLDKILNFSKFYVQNIIIIIIIIYYIYIALNTNVSKRFIITPALAELPI